MDDDKISSLPEHVKHHILSFLLSTKEVVRTSSLSKSWLCTLRSFQISDFKPWLITPDATRHLFRETGWGQEHTESFIRFVDGALMRSHDGMPRFRLYTTIEMAPHVDRWLRLALDNDVQELNIIVGGLGNLAYRVPEWVLSAVSVKSLTLTGAIKIDGIGSVNLPCLRSLYMGYTVVGDEMFHRLLGACPLLEDLCVASCSPLSVIDISNLNNLKRVMVGSRMAAIKVLIIKVSRLERFSFSCSCERDQEVSLVVDGSPSLKSVEFTGDFQNDEWFCRFISKFPRLESLTLDQCSSWKRIGISNPLLKKISIKNCYNLVDIRIDTPKLSSFYYEAFCSMRDTTQPSIWTKNPPHGCVGGFTFFLIQDPSSGWFEELHKFLTRCSTTFRSLASTVHLYEFEDDIEEDMSKHLTLSAAGVQHLKLVFEEFAVTYSVILDGLFSSCRPTTILVRATNPLLEFIYETLANREENPDCCSGDIRCWKHMLKDVQIERVEGTQHRGPVDWRTFALSLPTLSTDNEVCLKLQW